MLCEEGILCYLCSRNCRPTCLLWAPCREQRYVVQMLNSFVCSYGDIFLRFKIWEKFVFWQKKKNTQKHKASNSAADSKTFMFLGAGVEDSWTMITKSCSSLIPLP